MILFYKMYLGETPIYYENTSIMTEYSPNKKNNVSWFIVQLHVKMK
jgi:hypothetical protein